jgi:putative transcriptional regulator
MKVHKTILYSDQALNVEGRGSRKFKGLAGCGRWAAAFLLACILSGLLGPTARGADESKNKLEFLIARNQVNDPFFRHSVVVILPTTGTVLIVGLIINKPTHMTIGKLFPDSPELKARTDEAFFGGPVDVHTPSIVFESASVPENALKLYGDVYLTFDPDLISRSFQSPSSNFRPRLFLGRAQWAPGQLQNEIRRGGWYRLQAEGDLIFSSKPEDLWPRLHARAAPSKYIQYRLPPGSVPVPRQKISAM